MDQMKREKKLMRNGNGLNVLNVSFPYLTSFKRLFEQLLMITKLQIHMHDKGGLVNGRVENMALSVQEHLHDYITLWIVLPEGWEIVL